MLSFYLALIDDVSDQQLFEQIYNLYKKQMWFIANEKLKDGYLAEDAVHDVFKRIAVNIKSLRGMDEEKIRNYLFISAKHAALDIIKKRNKINAVNIDDFFNLQDIKANDEFEQLGNDKMIVSTLSQLPATYTDVMYLRFVLELPEKEIARQLGKNINTVRQQVARGKKIFADIYEKENKK